MPRTVLIVDDHPNMRQLVRSRIEDNTNWVVCGEAENGALAIERAWKLHPDVVILDLQMPKMNGLEAAKHIASLVPGTRMLMLTMHNSEELGRDAQAAGIQQVFSKSDGINQLIASLRSI